MDRDSFARLVERVYGAASPRKQNEWYGYLRRQYGDEFTPAQAEAVLLKTVRREQRRALLRQNTDETERPEASDFITRRVQEYRSSFVDLTPNDEESILALATIERQLQRIREQITTGERINGPADLKTLLDLQNALTSEHRQMQRTLGIDRRTRDDNAGGADVVDRVDEAISQAAEFYRQRCVEITHCGLKLGHILMHFRNWTVEGLCPRCGQKYVFTQDDMAVIPFVEENPDD
jgi:hypothetical protein